MNVAFRQAAEIDLADAMAWHDSQSAGLGQSLFSEVAASLERIKRKPGGYPVVAVGCRRALVRRFPYSIYFRIEPDLIVVLAVYHQRRNPDDLTERAK